MYVRRTAALPLFLFLSGLAASAQTISTVPVATAQVNDRVYTTTLALRNDGKQEANCEVIYALPHDPRRGTLRGRYTLPPGGVPQVELNAFSEGAAIGSLQIRCSAKVVIAARIQTSTDGGVTFDSGRTYSAVDEASGFRGSRSLAVDGDLFVAEVLGKPVTFEAIVTNKSGTVIARRTYAIEAFGLQIVNPRDLPSAAATRPAAVKIVVAAGEGAVVAGKETRDPDLLQLVARRDRTFTLAADAVSAAVGVASPSRVRPQLGTASFQAAPFHDSFTGLVYFRNRWYDPRTGSWLTPDPMGYTDSPNMYAFAKGDPVNHRDPTGEYIDETSILASPLAGKYTKWRDAFLQSPLGKQVWDQLHALPASVFTLKMTAQVKNAMRTYDSAATTSHVLDMNGVQTGAEISFGPDFGAAEPSSDYYSTSREVFNTDSRRSFYVQIFGHELGHVVGTWDSLLHAKSVRFDRSGVEINATTARFQALRRNAHRTGSEEQELQAIVTRRVTLLNEQMLLKRDMEEYAEKLGLLFYRSYRQVHGRGRVVGGKLTGPVTLPLTLSNNMPLVPMPPAPPSVP